MPTKSPEKVRVLVPVGNGKNSDAETAYSYQKLGATVDRIHMGDILRKPEVMRRYHILDLVGGFSDGDHIAAGKIQANRWKYELGDELNRFIVQDGKLVIGICNGFQEEAKAGILPGFDGDYSTQRLTLTINDSGKFGNRWVNLGVNQESNCVWTKGITELYLPVRHGEGKLRAEDNSVLERMATQNQIVLVYVDPETKMRTQEYPYNPNNSDNAIAGICDSTGRVFGMMPHREAYMFPQNHPNWTRLKVEGKLPKEGEGLQISRNGIEYAMENLL